MGTVTQPLRDEHAELLPHVETLRVAADSVGSLPVPELLPLVDDAHQFLVLHLIPHAQAEDVALYPTVARVMGAREATATMSRDHVEVGRLTEELTRLREIIATRRADESELRELRRVLYGLYALVRLHFAKEEEVYLPILDAQISAREAAEMFEAMERAAAQVKATVA